VLSLNSSSENIAQLFYYLPHVNTKQIALCITSYMATWRRNSGGDRSLCATIVYMV